MPPATSVRSIHLDAGGGGGGGGGTGAPGGYDQSLLAATPEVSRAAKQESYNVDLLETSAPTTHVLDPGNLTANNAGERQGGVNGANKEISYSSLPNRSRGVEDHYTGEDQQRHFRHRRPWIRRPVGLVTMAILFIVIVGAIVGGAVGGTVGHHKNDNSQQQQQVGSTSPVSGQQGVGPSGGGNATNPNSQGTPTGQQEQAVGGQI